MKLVSVKERLQEIKSIMARATYAEGEHEALINVRISDCPEWQNFIGEGLSKGRVVLHNDIKYLIVQDVTSVLESQPPNTEGMLSIYKPYRDSNEYEWLYGEYVEVGWIRYIVDESNNIIRYEAIQNPNANIYSPETVPAIWSQVGDNA